MKNSAFKKVILLTSFIFCSVLGFGQVSFSITKTGSATANPGDLITYTIAYSNTGSSIAHDVVITDILPSSTDYTYVSSFPTGTYNSGTNTIIWDSSHISDLAALGSGTRYITVTVRAGKIGVPTAQSTNGYYMSTYGTVNLQNRVTIQSTEVTSPVSSNTVTTTVTTNCSFVLSQPSSGIKSATNSTLTYLMAITNTGNIYQQYNLTSAHVSGIDVLTRSIQTTSGAALTITPFLAPGETYFFHYVLTVPPGTKPNEYNYTSVTATPSLCGTAITSDIETFIYGGQYKDYQFLGIYKVDNPDPVQSGGLLKYTIVVSNQNDAALPSVRVVETYPPNTTFVSSTPTPSSGNNIWFFTNLPVGNTLIEVTLQVANDLPNDTILSNTVTTGSFLNNVYTSYATFTEETTVKSLPNLSITKTATVVDPPAVPGSTVNYSITYTNIGNRTATNIVINDIYNSTYMSVVNATGGDTSLLGEIKWNINSLAPGASVTINYSMKIINNPSLFPAGTTNISNTVNITNDRGDSNVNNNTASATVTVSNLPDLYVTKSASPSSAEAGQPLAYTITYGNIGRVAHAGQNYTIVDTLPAGTILLNPTTLPNGGVYNSTNHTITWTLSNTLAPNAVNSMTINLGAIGCSLTGTSLVNSISINSTYYNDSNPSNNTFSLSTPVVDTTPPIITCNVSGTQTVDANSGSTYVHSGTTWDYTASDYCPNYTVTAALTGATTASGLPTLNNVTFNEGTTVVTWTVSDGFNTATCTFSVLVNAFGDLSISKTVESTQVIAGQELIYKIVVTNAGPSVAKNVFIADLITAFASPTFSTILGGPYTAWTSPYSAGNIPNGGSVTIYIKGTLSINQCSDVTNTASVSSDNDNNTANNSSTIVTPVLDQTNPAISTCPITRNIEGCSTAAITGPIFSTTLVTSDYATFSNATNQGVATDNCGITSVTYQDIASGTCPITVTRTWTLKDAAGNQATCQQTITITDTTAPTWTTAAGALNTSVECSDATGLVAAQSLFPVASDLCDTDVTNIDKVSGVYVAGTTCPQEGTYTNTWTVTDACSNTSTVYTQVITITDTTAPTWTTAAGALNTSVECSDATGLVVAQSLFPVASDLCDTDVTNIDKVSGVYVAGTTCPQEGTYTNTWTVTDACSNTSTVYTQVITITDTTAPTWTTAVGALNTSVECSDATGLVAAQSLFPVASDLCDTDVTNIDKVSGVYVAGTTCPQEGTYTNTWTVTDACSNTSTVYTQVITITDTTAPTWTTAAGALNTSVECSDATGLVAAQSLFPVASDLCDTDVTNIDKVSGVYVAGTTCPQEGTYTNTWTVTDACSNTSTVYTQVITITDTTAPTWTTAAGALNTSVECSDATGLVAAQSLFPVASDLCDTDVTNIDKVSGVYVAGTTCPQEGTYTNTWTVTDACSNTSTVYTQVITITDTTAPTWTTAAGALNTSVECSDATGLVAAQSLFPVASDLCDTDVTNIDKVSGVYVAGTTCPQEGTYTNTWTVTDACSNTSTVYTQVITITDTTAPTWTTAAGALNTSVECSDATGLVAAQSLFPVASDLCDTDVTNIDKVSGVYVAGTTCPQEGTYTNTWTVTDACSNTSTVYTQVITITDTTAPTWTTAAGALNTSVECSDATGLVAAQSLFPVASDLCDTDVTNIDKVSGVYVAGTTCPQEGTYTNTWTVTDACSNTSTVYTQVITITDTTAPTWTTAAGALNTSVECSDATGLVAAQSLFPVASDLCDTDVTNIDKVSGVYVAGTTCPQEGTYTNTWTVTDACSNTSTVYTQVITITDTTAPTWTTAAGALNTSVECSDATGLVAAQSLFPVASDLCDTDVTNIDKVSGVYVAGTTCPQEGTYTNTWTVTDACSNTSTVYTQVITITDTTAPTWTTAAGALNTSVECSDATGLVAAQSLFPVASDLCDTDVTNIDKVSGVYVAGTTCPQEGTYTNTWTVTDACSNTSTVYTQVITITDTTAPTWTTAAGALNTSVECSDATGLVAAQSLFPVASDLCDTDVTNIDKVSGVYVAGTTCPQEGTYTNTWTVTDACSNTSTVYTQVITITDNTAPTWTTVAGNLDRTVECSDATALAAAQSLFPVASDLCDTDVTNIDKVSGVYVAGTTCPQEGTYTNTWTVTDACSNTSTVYTQVITITDTTAPTWTTAAGALNTSVECSDATGLVAAQSLFPVASDLCDTDVTNIDKVSGVYVAGTTCPQEGTYTNTWTVTDACSNTSTVYTQVITITDNTAPTWTTAAGALNTSVECSDATGLVAAQSLFPVASDLCDTDVTNIDKVSGVYVAGTTCPQEGTYTNTWTVTDACSNTSTVYTQVITITDNTAPTWTTVAGNLDRTVECSDATALAAAQSLFPVASDLCDTDVTNIDKVSGVYVAGTTCPQEGTYTNTWTVTDACSNTSTVYTQVITITDTTAPTWTTAAGALNTSVECSDATGLVAAQSLFPVASDLCDTDVTNIDKVSGVYVAGTTCPQEGTYTNTWTVTDACSNTSTVYTQVITITDNTAPTLTCPSNVNQTTDAGQNYATVTIAIPTVIENCGTYTLTNNYTGTSNASGQYPIGNTTVTYTATDTCGNTRTCNFTVTVGDNQAPTITCPPTINIQCSVDIPVAYATYTDFVNAGGSASDNDDINPASFALQRETSDNNTCFETITRVYTISDTNGNTSTCAQQIVIDDNTNPTASNPISIIVDCIADIPAPDVSLVTDEVDNCTINPIVTWVSDTSNAPTIPRIIIRTYSVTDNCNNQITVTQTLTGKYDYIPAPTGNTPQQFCTGQTLSEINVSNTAGYTNILWYATNSTAGSTLPDTTVLTDGTTYYAFQGEGTCATGLAVTTEIETTIPAPIANSPQQFCNDGTMTVSDLNYENTTGFNNIYWYPTNDNAGQALASTTVLVNGTTYYGFQGDGDCAVSVAVTVQLLSDIPAPIANSPQQFCNDGTMTVSDINYENTTGFNNIYWYPTNDNAGQALASTTVLVNGTTYYGFQGDGDCAVSVAVTVQLLSDIPAPIANSPQQFCNDGTMTVSDLNYENTTGFNNIYWYPTNDNAGQALASTTVLVNGTTYYGFQGDGDCAVSVAVTVQLLSDIPAPIANSPQQFCNDGTMTVSDLNYENTTGFNNIYWYPTNDNAGQALASTTVLVNGTTYYGFQGDGDCAVSVAVTVQLLSDIPAPIANSPQQFCNDGTMTVSDLNYENTTGFNNIYWYPTNDNAGQALASTTVLVNGTTYYGFQGDGDCAVSVAVTVQLLSDIPAPIANSPQQFCNDGTMTVSDLNYENTTGFNNIYWYPTNDNAGQALASTTVLVNGTTYYGFQGDGDCAVSVAVTVQLLSDIPAPIANSPQQFCNDGTMTVSDLNYENTTGFNNIYWYPTNDNAGQALASTTVLVNGTTYYGFQGDGDCAVSVAVTVQLLSDIPAPIANSPQQFCNDGTMTVSDLNYENTTGFNNIYWYPTNDNAGQALASTTVLVNGTTYYGFQGDGDCAVSVAVTVQLLSDIPAPIANSPQQFCNDGTMTVSDLNYENTTGFNNIYWYPTNDNAGQALASTTVLVNGTTYYGFQGDGDCAVSVAVTVQLLSDIPAPIANSPQQFCNDGTMTVSDLNYENTTGFNNIYWYPTNDNAGQALASTTVLVNGTTYYGFQGDGDCAVSVAVTVQLLSDIPAPIANSPQQFCNDGTMTVSDLNYENTTGFNNIYWYPTNDNAGQALASTTVLVNGTTYYGFQGDGDCAVSVAVTVQLLSDIPAPIANSPQQFCNDGTMTVSDLNYENTTGFNNIYWYPTNDNAGQALASTTVLVNGTTYYGFQGDGDCAVSVAVTVQLLSDIPAPIANSPQQFCNDGTMTVSDLNYENTTGFNNIYWYPTNDNAGQALASTTVLVNGTTYYGFQGDGDCAVSVAVTVQLLSDIPAPIANSPQQFCNDGTMTVSDLNYENTTGFNNIYWYPTNDNAGQALASTTVLVNGTTYYGFQGDGDCAVSVAVTVQLLSDIPAPIANSPQQFCNDGTMTVSDLNYENTTGFNNIYWYPTNDNAGQALASTTVLVNGTTYYGFQGDGDCAVSVAVTVQLLSDIPAPIANSPQQFCNDGTMTVSDLNYENTTGFNNIYWYPTNDNAGQALASTTVLVNGTTYYGFQGDGDCAVSVAVTVQLLSDIPAPIANSPQQFCNDGTMTVSDLNYENTTGFNNIYWYPTNDNAGQALASTTVLVNGTTYYGFQGDGDCAVSVAVTVQLLSDIPAPIANSPQQFCNDGTMTVSDLNYENTTGFNNIYWYPTNDNAGQALASTTVLVNGTTYYGFQGDGDCAVSVAVTVQLLSDIPAPIANSPQQFCNDGTMTVSDLNYENTTGFNNIYWYPTNDNAGQALASTTVLVNGTTYYGFQGDGDCAVSVAVTVQLLSDIPAPIANSPQQFCNDGTMTVSDLNYENTTGFNNIYWYPTNDNAGQALASTTVLVNGTTYYGFQGDGDCAVSVAVTVQLLSDIPAPIANSPQQFCNDGTMTVSDLNYENTTGFNNIYWYPTNDNAGQALASTTVLVNGTTYYGFQGDGDCAVSVAVTVQLLSDIPAPIANSPQQFCNDGTMTVSDLNYENTTGFNNIYWYPTNDNAGQALASTTVLVNGTTYYGFQGDGDCAVSVAVTVQLLSDIPAPIANSPQQFCNDGTMTVSDLNYENTTGFNNIYWYPTNDNAGQALASTTVLVNGTTYYGFQGDGDCAVSVAVTVQLLSDIPAPIANSPQQFCNDGTMTVSDINYENTTGFNNIYWYPTNDNAGQALASTTVLVNGTTYYGFQGDGDCAVSVAVTVQLLSDIPAPIANSPQQFCNDGTMTVSDLNYENTTGFNNIYWYPTNDNAGQALASTTVLVNGTTYYGFQGDGDCAVSVAVTVQLLSDIPAPIANSPQQFCNDGTMTVSDINYENTTGFNNIYWYPTNDNAGQALASTTVLVNGTTYYGFQGDGDCAVSVAVTVQLLSDIPAPIANSPQQFCNDGTMTVSDLNYENTTGFNNIYWYPTNDNAGQALASTTVLVNGTTYYGFQGDGDCAVSVAVTVQLLSDIPAPIANSPQQFCNDGTMTVSDLNYENTTGFNNIYWYPTNDNAGQALASTTVLVNGTTYYGFQGDGDCAVSVAVTVQLLSDIPAPIANSPQQFCNDGTMTVSDLNYENTTGFNNIYWYPTNDNAGQALASTTVLVNGTTYYGFQGDGDCAVSVAVTVQLLSDIPAPIANSPQQFCNDGTMTVSDINYENTTGFNNIYWYPTNDNAGQALASTTVLVNGTTYYGFQGDGDCAVSVAVTVQLLSDIPAPIANSPQQFCNDGTMTVSDINYENTTGFNNIYWYPTNDNAGQALASTTVLVNGTTYYGFQGDGDCAVSVAVTVQLLSDIPAPIGNTTQYYCSTDYAILSDLIVNNTTGFSNIYWYANNSTDGSPLSNSTTLVVGTIYYAFQGEGDCASSLSVTVVENCEYVTVTKVSDVDLVDEAGDVINYTVTITNTNILPVTNVIVNDPMLGGVLAGPASGDINNNNILDPYESWVYIGSYTVTQQDIDTYGGGDGDIDNTVIVTVTGPSENNVTIDASDIVLIDYTNNGEPVFSVTKEADVESVSHPGEVITYTITVVNTSNFAIGNIDINDPLIDNLHLVSGDVDNDGLLDVNETWIFQGTYTVTLDDLMAFGIDYSGVPDHDGDIDNIVYVNGTNPSGNDVEEATATETVLVEFIFIPDGFSPDGDGHNDEFEIIGLAELYPNFTIRIYNRWGNMVYDYDNNGRPAPDWWDGISNGRLTLDKNVKEPTGTYYYVIDYNDGIRQPLVDWIYLTRKND